MHNESVVDYYQRRKTPGEIIKSRRRELDWSQDELEWRSGVSRTFTPHIALKCPHIAISQFAI